MNAFRRLIVAGVLALLAGSALAADAPPAVPSSGSIAAVVNVDVHGQVKEILPSATLPAWMHDALVRQLQAWITKPATDKEGKPISSRFIMVVAMDAAPRSDGGYDAKFGFVKTMPIGFGGPVHWNSVDRGRELQLVSDIQPANGGFRQIPVPGGGMGSIGSGAGAAPPPPPPPPPPPASGGGH